MPRSRLQFSVLAVLLVLTGAGGVFRVWTMAPSEFACLLALALAVCVTAVAVAGAFYGQGNVRAFSIGALLPLGLLICANFHYFHVIPTARSELERLSNVFVVDPFAPRSPFNDHRRVIVLMMAGIVTGALAVTTKWLLTERDSQV